MNILIACEESQVVTCAFRAKGHNAFSCDLQDCSGGHPEWHIKGDVLGVLNPNVEYGDPFFVPPYEKGIEFYTCTGDYHFIADRWDMIIAHPPCTFLACSGACKLLNKDHTIKDWDRYFKMLEARGFFYACLSADCEKICVENPKLMAIAELPLKSMVLQPWEFGEDYTKMTYFWLKGLPPLMPSIGGIDYDIPSWCHVHSSAKIRSKTFPKVALAMAEQWG